jgi:hypothetical protein
LKAWLNKTLLSERVVAVGTKEEGNGKTIRVK